MRFTAAFTSLVLAAAVVASPIAAPAVAERQTLCQIGMPCFMQAEVNNAVNFANEASAAVQQAVAILQGPVDAVVADVEAAGNSLLAVGAKLASDASQMSADMKAQLKAQVNAAIAVVIVGIQGDLSIISNGAPVFQGDLQNAVSIVQNAIVAIEAVIGPCTS